MIRIISGKHRGRKIQAPKNLPVRPTTDRAKESLFNILNNHFYFDEVTALDLCSGTGNISYELASRGCPDIIAIDDNHACVKFIQETAEKLEMDTLHAFRAEIFQFVEKDSKTYDLIFADPPFDFDQYEKLVEKIFEKNLLSEEGFLVVEHQSMQDLSSFPHFSNVRAYGNVSFSFFEHGSEEEGE